MSGETFTVLGGKQNKLIIPGKAGNKTPNPPNVEWPRVPKAILDSGFSSLRAACGIKGK